MAKDADTTWIDVEIKAATDLAVMVTNGKKTAWVPRSQIIDSESDLEIGAHTKIEIATWLAEEKGLE